MMLNATVASTPLPLTGGAGLRSVTTKVISPVWGSTLLVTTKRSSATRKGPGSDLHALQPRVGVLHLQLGRVVGRLDFGSIQVGHVCNCDIHDQLPLILKRRELQEHTRRPPGRAVQGLRK